MPDKRPSYISPPLPLWGAMSRATNPDTSHDAARRAPVADHHQRILEALTSGPAGQSGLADRTGLTIAQVSKRLSELRTAGLIERDGETRSASGGRESRYRRVVASR